MANVEGVFLPEDRFYDPKEHLWVKIEEGLARVGIDELGRWAAGTISFLHFHAPGKRLARRGAAFGSLEANKFVGALRAPVRGVLRAVNPELLENPALVNEDPYGKGWFALIDPSHLEEDLAELVWGDEAITTYLSTRIEDYRERGILPEGPEETLAREPW